MLNTHGWEPIYDLKDQCGRCQATVQEHRMAACEYNRREFPAAHNCPVWRPVVEGSDDHQ